MPQKITNESQQLLAISSGIIDVLNRSQNGENFGKAFNFNRANFTNRNISSWQELKNWKGDLGNKFDPSRQKAILLRPCFNFDKNNKDLKQIVNDLGIAITSQNNEFLPIEPDNDSPCTREIVLIKQGASYKVEVKELETANLGKGKQKQNQEAKKPESEDLYIINIDELDSSESIDAINKKLKIREKSVLQQLKEAEDKIENFSEDEDFDADAKSPIFYDEGAIPPYTKNSDAKSLWLSDGQINLCLQPVSFKNITQAGKYILPTEGFFTSYSKIDDATKKEKNDQLKTTITTAYKLVQQHPDSTISIPINLDNSHWLLAKILGNGQIVIWDSRPKPYGKDAVITQKLNKLKTALEEIGTENAVNVTIEHAGKQKGDSWTCGDWIIREALEDESPYGNKNVQDLEQLRAKTIDLHVEKGGERSPEQPQETSSVLVASETSKKLSITARVKNFFTGLFNRQSTTEQVQETFLDNVIEGAGTGTDADTDLTSETSKHPGDNDNETTDIDNVLKQGDVLNETELEGITDNNSNQTALDKNDHTLQTEGPKSSEQPDVNSGSDDEGTNTNTEESDKNEYQPPNANEGTDADTDVTPETSEQHSILNYFKKFNNSLKKTINEILATLEKHELFKTQEDIIDSDKINEVEQKIRIKIEETNEAFIKDFRTLENDVNTFKTYPVSHKTTRQAIEGSKQKIAEKIGKLESQITDLIKLIERNNPGFTTYTQNLQKSKLNSLTKEINKLAQDKLKKLERVFETIEEGTKKLVEEATLLSGELGNHISKVDGHFTPTKNQTDKLQNQIEKLKQKLKAQVKKLDECRNKEKENDIAYYKKSLNEAIKDLEEKSKTLSEADSKASKALAEDLPSHFMRAAFGHSQNNPFVGLFNKLSGDETKAVRQPLEEQYKELKQKAYDKDGFIIRTLKPAILEFCKNDNPEGLNSLYEDEPQLLTKIKKLLLEFVHYQQWQASLSDNDSKKSVIEEAIDKAVPKDMRKDYINAVNSACQGDKGPLVKLIADNPQLRIRLEENYETLQAAAKSWENYKPTINATVIAINTFESPVNSLCATEMDTIKNMEDVNKLKEKINDLKGQIEINLTLYMNAKDKRNELIKKLKDLEDKVNHKKIDLEIILGTLNAEIKDLGKRANEAYNQILSLDANAEKTEEYQTQVEALITQLKNKKEELENADYIEHSEKGKLINQLDAAISYSSSIKLLPDLPLEFMQAAIDSAKNDPWKGLGKLQDGEKKKLRKPLETLFINQIKEKGLSELRDAIRAGDLDRIKKLLGTHNELKDFISKHLNSLRQTIDNPNWLDAFKGHYGALNTYLDNFVKKENAEYNAKKEKFIKDTLQQAVKDFSKGRPERLDRLYQNEPELLKEIKATIVKSTQYQQWQDSLSDADPKKGFIERTIDTAVPKNWRKGYVDDVNKACQNNNKKPLAKLIAKNPQLRGRLDDNCLNLKAAAKSYENYKTYLEHYKDNKDDEANKDPYAINGLIEKLPLNFLCNIARLKEKTKFPAIYNAIPEEEVKIYHYAIRQANSGNTASLQDYLAKNQGLREAFQKEEFLDGLNAKAKQWENGSVSPHSSKEEWLPKYYGRETYGLFKVEVDNDNERALYLERLASYILANLSNLPTEQFDLAFDATVQIKDYLLKNREKNTGTITEILGDDKYQDLKEPIREAISEPFNKFINSGIKKDALDSYIGQVLSKQTLKESPSPAA